MIGADDGLTFRKEELELLQRIGAEDERLIARYADVLRVNSSLDRKLVSFQANKAEIGSRWFRYKEGFSAGLMRYVFGQLGISSGHILDPFAGSGTALFCASEQGLDATGIELLPSSIETIEVRRLVLESASPDTARLLHAFRDARPWEKPGQVIAFPHLTITRGAFPEDTERLLGRYLYEASQVSDPLVARLLRFAAMCVLEAISFTRKDGQYLRWDYRSGRRAGTKPFDKGRILDFTSAISAKLEEIAGDLVLLQTGQPLDGPLFAELRPQRVRGRVRVIPGSCLAVLPTLPEGVFDAVITSPPYCNRYDYTRTYALELAMLGIEDHAIRDLRQSMLSCTVENRDKLDLASRYAANVYEAAMGAWSSHQLLCLLLRYLEGCRERGVLNNPGIPRMVRNYFREMALVIFELARVLKPGAPLIMVNDNVRYQGAHVPVDLILSDFAARAGFAVEAIWVLPRGKGNSSQQMGAHGRQELRKCVYLWRRLRAEPARTPDHPLSSPQTISCGVTRSEADRTYEGSTLSPTAACSQCDCLSRPL